MGTIIQFPFEGVDDHESMRSTKSIRGKYASVEQVREIRGEGGVTVEWRYVQRNQCQLESQLILLRHGMHRMTTCSSPGGSIPAFISERSIPGEIAKVHSPFRISSISSAVQSSRADGVVYTQYRMCQPCSTSSRSKRPLPNALSADNYQLMDSFRCLEVLDLICCTIFQPRTLPSLERSTRTALDTCRSFV